MIPKPLPEIVLSLGVSVPHIHCTALASLLASPIVASMRQQLEKELLLILKDLLMNLEVFIFYVFPFFTCCYI